MSATSPLLPRYRRPLTFGAILDESFQIYRRTWLTMVTISALWAFPYVLVSLLTNAVSSNFVGSDPGVNPRDPSAAFAFAGRALAYALGLEAILMPFSQLGYGAVTALTGSVLRGERGSVWRAYAVGFRCLIPIVGAVFVWYLAFALLSVLAVPLFVLGVFGLLGGLIALVGIIVWAANPAARRPALKWLIILATPFGLPVYFGVRWWLCDQAVVLEGAGPIAALRRSGELVRGHWFHVLGVSLVAGAISMILQSIPSALVTAALLFVLGPAAQDPTQSNVGVQIANGAASLIGIALFGAIWSIVSTLLFVDLRNRHEGADLAERLDELEAGVPSAA